jgi:hypothetical protein
MLKRRWRSRRKWTKVPKANAHKVMRRFLKGVAIHWVGPAVPQAVYEGREKSVATYLEGVRRFHRHSRGWSDIAYNLAVDTKGRIWDLRGVKHLSGANGDSDVNMEYLAVVALLGKGQKPTPEMLKGIRKAVRRIRRRYPFRARKVVTHGDIRPDGTECPGRRLTKEVRNGTFEPMGLRKLIRQVVSLRAKKG